jgi:RimJ/RimL family protein N-acetyltransferase
MSGTSTAFLIGPRVILRTHTETDLDSWYAWFNDPGLTEGMYKGLFPNTLEKQKRLLLSMYENEVNLQLAIEHEESGRLIGTIGLHAIDFFHATADISILIGEREFLRHGFGKEALSLIVAHAFQKLCLEKLTSGMYAENIASRKLFESSLFTREATLRAQVKWKGRRIDLYKYGLLAAEWRAKAANKE